MQAVLTRISHGFKSHRRQALIALGRLSIDELLTLLLALPVLSLHLMSSAAPKLFI